MTFWPTPVATSSAPFAQARPIPGGAPVGGRLSLTSVNAQFSEASAHRRDPVGTHLSGATKGRVAQVDHAWRHPELRGWVREAATSHAWFDDPAAEHHGAAWRCLLLYRSYGLAAWIVGVCVGVPGLDEVRDGPFGVAIASDVAP